MGGVLACEWPGCGGRADAEIQTTGQSLDGTLTGSVPDTVPDVTYSCHDDLSRTVRRQAQLAAPDRVCWIVRLIDPETAGVREPALTAAAGA